MKWVKFVLILYLFMAGKVSFSQDKKLFADTSVAFKVSGACEMCKDRIETTAKIRGVKKAEWDVDSKILSLIYNPSLASLEKIQNRIVAAGHDLEDKKTKDVVYNALPKCCHYREMETMMDKMMNQMHSSD